MLQAELHLPADVAYIGLARLVVTTAARQFGMSDERLEDLRIAVSEAATNAVTARNDAGDTTPVIVAFGHSDDAFRVAVHGIGHSFEEPTGVFPGQDWAPDESLGLHLIRDLVDDLEIDHGDETVVRMRFSLHDNGRYADDSESGRAARA